MYIGNFISRHVYNGRLISSHPDATRACCVFVDVSGEETKDGHSSIVGPLVSATLHHSYSSTLEHERSANRRPRCQTTAKVGEAVPRHHTIRCTAKQA